MFALSRSAPGLGLALSVLCFGGLAAGGDAAPEKADAPAPAAAETSLLKGSLADAKLGDWARYDLWTTLGEAGRMRTPGRRTVTVVERTETEIALRVDVQRVNRMARRPRGENAPQDPAPADDGVQVTSTTVRVPLNRPYDLSGLLPDAMELKGVERKTGPGTPAELLVAGQAMETQVASGAWTLPAEALKDLPAMTPEKGSLKIWTNDDFPFRVVQWEATGTLPAAGQQAEGRGGRPALPREVKQTLLLAASGDLAHPDAKADEKIQAPRFGRGGQDGGGDNAGNRGGRGDRPAGGNRGDRPAGGGGGQRPPAR